MRVCVCVHVYVCVCVCVHACLCVFRLPICKLTAGLFTLCRWFDKCIQLVVSKNSVIGANVEHSLIDATVSLCERLWVCTLRQLLPELETVMLCDMPSASTPDIYCMFESLLSLMRCRRIQ